MSSLPRSSSGFTLLELMVSMAIGAVVLTLSAALLGASGDGYERVDGTIDAEGEARALMAQLGSDLSTSVYHDETLLEKESVSWPLDRIGLFHMRPDDVQSEAGRIGDLCAVYYYIKDQTIGGKTVRCLMRGVHESDETFRALRSGKAASLFTENPLLDEPLAFGVVSFEVTPKILDANYDYVDWVKAGATTPTAVEVRLVVARRNLAGKLVSPADWSGEGSSGKLLGDPQNADKNKSLEVYQALIRFGN
jgi:prepilin-type N-terminal cleavage/methylation domain-containing protein